MLDYLSELLGLVKEWSGVIAGFGSLVLSYFLVSLYKQQKNLIQNQFNREVRESHTETLKERIREWHGDMDDGPFTHNDDFIEKDTNLPSVKSASVDPAPAILEPASSTEFRVVPPYLAADAYFEDLIENHAEDLNILIKEINAQYEEFIRLKDSFCNRATEKIAIERENYRIEKTADFEEWLFELVVRNNRSSPPSPKDNLQDYMSGDPIKKETSSYYPHTILFSANSIGNEEYRSLKLVLDEDQGFKRREEAIRRDVGQVFESALEEISDEERFEDGVDAARTLDSMRESITELEHKLVEYEGSVVFTEECPLTKDATVSSDENTDSISERVRSRFR